MSVVPPAGKGTMTRIGFDGKPCANTVDANARAAARTVRRDVVRMGSSLYGVSVRVLPGLPDHRGPAVDLGLEHRARIVRRGPVGRLRIRADLIEALLDH